MSTTDPTGQPTEEELRAAYEAQMSRIRVEHVIFDQISMLADLGMRRTGLAPGTEEERDPDQVRLAIEGIKAMTPLVEQIAPDQVAPIRQVLSQMQMAYVRIGGPAGADAGTPGGEPAGTNPAGTNPAGTAPAGASPAGTGLADAAGFGQTPAGAPRPAAAQSAPQGPAPEEPLTPGEPGPAQRSGRLWIPGQ